MFLTMLLRTQTNETSFHYFKLHQGWFFLMKLLLYTIQGLFFLQVNSYGYGHLEKTFRKKRA